MGSSVTADGEGAGIFGVVGASGTESTTAVVESELVVVSDG
jgi:hypothetical protein